MVEHLNLRNLLAWNLVDEEDNTKHHLRNYGAFTSDDCFDEVICDFDGNTYDIDGIDIVVTMWPNRMGQCDCCRLPCTSSSEAVNPDAQNRGTISTCDACRITFSDLCKVMSQYHPTYTLVAQLLPCVSRAIILRAVLTDNKLQDSAMLSAAEPDYYCYMCMKQKENHDECAVELQSILCDIRATACKVSHVNLLVGNADVASIIVKLLVDIVWAGYTWVPFVECSD